MNKVRRKKIKEIFSQLEELQNALSELQEEEEAAWENMPESLQNTEQYNNMEECAANLSYAVSDIQTVMDDIADMCP